MSVAPEVGPTANEAGGPPPSFWLLRCSRERTLFARRRDDGRVDLVKVFETGTLEDARHEAALGRLAAVRGVVQYHDATVDQTTGRPCVVLEHHAGIDLQTWLDERGPLTPRAAARVTRDLAHAVAALHALESAHAPAGIVHRDVKPANVLLAASAPDPFTSEVLLLDFEHALAAGNGHGAASAVRGFTGGTPAFAPPEAFDGAAPSRAFDAFGLGATLQALLCGSPPYEGDDHEAIAQAVRRGRRMRATMRGLPAALVALVEQCLAPEPEHRPTAAEIETRLDQFLATNDELERRADHVLAAIWSGQLDEAAAMLAELGDGARAHDLALLLQRRRARLARAGTAWQTIPAEPPLALAQALVGEPAALARLLRRFPLHPRARVAARQWREAAARLVQRLPPLIADLKRDAAFDAAATLVQTALQGVMNVERALGHLPVAASHALPGLLQRDPQRFLYLALTDVREAAAGHARIVERLREAETALELDAVERALAAAASVYGGASEVVASWKDRVHRLRFYLERAARCRERLDGLREQLETAGLTPDLAPLRQLLELCARRVGAGAEAPRASAGLRALQRTLHDLVAEFPHAAPALDLGMRSLDTALGALTDRAWAMLEEAQAKLLLTPIPIKPLQVLIHRIDALRLLEALVDRPARARADLLEELERVRLRIEAARATRDRIARGAQEAIERGHLTTAMFEIARVVDRFAPGEGEDGSGTAGALVQKLEEAKRMKAAIAQAAARNQELAARYARLQDERGSAFDERLQTLERRRDVLEFLVRQLQAERAEPYLRDLRDVDVQVLTEQAEEAEREFDLCAEASGRLRIARQTLERLRLHATGSSGGATPGDGPVGRVQRILERWQLRCERALHDVRAEQETTRTWWREVRRRRLVRLAKAVLFVALLFGVFQGARALGRGEPLTALQQSVAAELRAPFEPARAAAHRQALGRFVARLESGSFRDEHAPGASATLAAARKLQALVEAAAAQNGGLRHETFLPELRAALAAYDDALGRTRVGERYAELRAALARFGAQSHAAAAWSAAASANDAAKRAAVRAHLAVRLPPTVELGATQLRELDALLGR